MSRDAQSESARERERNAFLTRNGLASARIIPLVPDASARRYFRLHHASGTSLLMDAPPPGEKPEAFVLVTGYLEKLGARVPRILASDIDLGLILIEDLGDQTMTRLLQQGADETRLYTQALDALVDMQTAFTRCATDIKLPLYDLDATLAEAELLVRWYLPARLERPMESNELTEFRALWSELFESLPDLPDVLVHRDYHVDNLLISSDKCAMLDYQDALLGSPVYDLVSLLEDARRDVDTALSKRLIARWQQQLQMDQTTFDCHYIFWGAQRHSKVAGIFVRLWLRDGKTAYLEHLPRVMGLLKHKLEAPFMAPLQQWLKQRIPNLDHRLLPDDPAYLSGFPRN